MDISAGIAAELALTKQAIAMSVMKQSVEMEQKMVEIIAQAADTVPVSSTRGSALNVSV